MVEAVSYNRPSVAKSILASSVLSGVLSAGVRVGCELYEVKTAPKKYKQLADEYFKEAVKMEAQGLIPKRDQLLEAAEYIESMKNYKFNWKNVGKGAMFGALAAAVLCSVIYGVGALFNRK